MNILIIHHSSDNDGLASAAVCQHFIHKFMPSGLITLHGIDYGQTLDLEWVRSYDFIYLVDFSHDELLNDPSLRAKLTWIDHHKSAIEKYDTSIRGLRFDGVAACRLCYLWFKESAVETPFSTNYTDKLDVFYALEFYNEPLWLRLIGEHDVWDHHDHRAMKLNAGLGRFSNDELIDSFTRLLSDISSWSREWADAQCTAGGVILRYLEAQDAKSMPTICRPLVFFGLQCLVANAGKGSRKFRPMLEKYPDTQAFVAWQMTANGLVTVSLYRDADMKPADILSIAKKHGGGGHEGACGFTTTWNEWVLETAYDFGF